MPDAAIPTGGHGSVVTVGTFDGVHRGHWRVLQQVRERAAALGGPGVLVTFDPHPLRIVRPESAPPLLTTPVEKTEILAESGLTYAVFVAFTREVQQLSPEEFVHRVLVERLRVAELVIGYDHGFGRGRSGDVDTLRRIGEDVGFAVHVVPPVEADGAPISSSRIRAAVQEGDMRAAAAGLGRPYSLRGVVVRGDGRGRGLGFPTANIHVPEGDKLLPRPGIYAARGILRSGPVGGVLHLGPRPTFPGAPPTIELHLFDFDADLYGEPVRVDFIDRIRDIQPFGSVGELVAAMEADAQAARVRLNG
ncbi:MAG TPA: bifunctional riboflavin kinase/FAD synthetase [Longimicrobiales bacterium]